MSYSTTEISELLGLNYNQTMQIHRWREAGAIIPSIAMPRGPGTRARWSNEDFRRLRCIFDVVEQFYALDLQMSGLIVRDIWRTLGRNEPWELCFSLAMEPVSA